MSLTSYTELQQAIADWLERADLATRIPDFIALLEAAANRRLRVRQQEASTTLTPSDGAVALPADYLMWRRVTWTGSNRVDLQYVHPSYLQAAYPSSPSDVPRIFTIEGSTMKVRPVDNTALEFDYFQKVPRALRGRQLALHRASRSLPVRVAGRGVPVRAGEGRVGPWVESAPRRDLRRDRDIEQQDPRSGSNTRHGPNAVGWVEPLARSRASSTRYGETHRRSRRERDDGFRCAQPILQGPSMTITNFSELKAAIEDYLVRTNTQLNARTEDFIALFEGRLNRTLRVADMQKVGGMTPAFSGGDNSGAASLPADYLEWTQASWTDGTNVADLRYVEPDSEDWRFRYRPFGLPSMFTIIGTTFFMRPHRAGMSHSIITLRSRRWRRTRPTGC